jgi:farnesyl-diphosphate farnesyltransferase
MNDHDLLGDLLKNVSRSFYLTLRVLPDGLREPIGLAYLLARAADTIADTAIISPELRLEFLLSLRAQVNDRADAAQLQRIESALIEHQSNRHERNLLQSLQPALQSLELLDEFDRQQVRHVVTVLTQGMEFDLNYFPHESSGQLGALQTQADLERYTYLVAGCVGDFWTQMTARHTTAFQGCDIGKLSATGIRFGKALQYTNVLRDCAKDLRIGRCYLPLERLQGVELKPEDLFNISNSQRARPVLTGLLAVALGHYREAATYTLTVPERFGRLRLACLWPILIGLETLKRLAVNDAWLDPGKPSKVSRREVYKMMAFSLPTAGSDTVIRGWMEGLISDVEKRTL